jgi:hypothetical protein
MVVRFAAMAKRISVSGTRLMQTAIFTSGSLSREQRSAKSEAAVPLRSSLFATR